MKENEKEKVVNLKDYVEKNREDISKKCWDILIKILNDRNDGNKYELSNPQ